MKPHSLILAAALASVTLAWGQTTTTLQTWTASDGRVIQAKFIKLDGESVVIEKDGKPFTVPFAKLNAASVEQAKKLGGVAPPAPALVAAPVAATGVSIAPGNFLGKIFEQCEAQLGKPDKVKEPDGRSRAYARTYKSPVPGVSRIMIAREPEGSMQGPVPERVNYLWYYFPKGTIKSLGEAFDLIGLSKEGAKIGVSYSTYGLSKEEAENVRKKASEVQQTASMSAALDREFSRSVSEINGDLVAHWSTAESSMRMPPEYQHPDEDALSVSENPNRRVAPTPKLALQTSPELEKNGAFGFPQASAKVLGNATVKELRLSAWSNAEWLYVQAVIWADGDDAAAVVPDADGKMRTEGSTLNFILDEDEQSRDRVEIRCELAGGGLTVLLTGDRRNDYVVKGGSAKSRGSIQYVPAADGKKIRVDSFLIPLAELHRKPGEKIRLRYYGQSAVPGFDFNSAGSRLTARNGERGPMVSSGYANAITPHEFTVGEQTGTIDPAQVPDPGVK